jgi:hypothetical protein
MPCPVKTLFFRRFGIRYETGVPESPEYEKPHPDPVEAPLEHENLPLVDYLRRFNDIRRLLHDEEDE